MTTTKRITDLTQYTNVLPYASEMFGIYQPLLGWKSKRIEERFKKGFQRDRSKILEKLIREFAGIADVKYGENNQISIQIKPGSLQDGKLRNFDSLVLKQIASELPAFQDYDPTMWARIITQEKIDNFLNGEIAKHYIVAFLAMQKSPSLGVERSSSTKQNQNTDALALLGQLDYESKIAGMLLFLTREKQHDALKEIFYASVDNLERARNLARMASSDNSIEAFFNINTIDPRNQEHLNNVALSPIAVVHLFRQYFFELDTFLGTPENHVWLSPGSSVELIEVHTRKTVVEKTLETTLDLFTKTEKSTTERDEISDAVKEDNKRDIGLGASVTASYGSIEATASFDYKSSQQSARETTHKRMREQTEKLSSEVRKTFKSTFKTISEFTDVSSVKHVLANNTNDLINYELRRKMRQVGVQVQDIGTYLCWRTYVDDPGKELGLAKLIHVAKPAELDGIPHPEEIPLLQPFQEPRQITIPFIALEGGADNSGEVYVSGEESDNTEWFADMERILAVFPQVFICSKAKHELKNVEFNTQGKPVVVSRGNITNSEDRASFDLNLNYADFEGQNSIPIELILHWSPKPEANADIITKNAELLANTTEREKAAYEKAYIDTVKERVTFASRITTRNSADLREEERIVVYRSLIQEMLMNGIPLPDDKTRHVVAELLDSIFDVDKMLYFVAPEWWRPRLHRSKQQLQEQNPLPIRDVLETVDVTEYAQRKLTQRAKGIAQKTDPSVMSANTVGWGGINEVNRDNYFITEESEPARLGSSLGWLLQLDGDNMRNAFLNAPWVKAIIPIRPGKEEAAINWLKSVEGINGITDDVMYQTDNPNEVDINGVPLNGQKFMDVIMNLAETIRRKHRDGINTDKFPKPDEVSDPTLVDEENTVTSTPIDRVYEHGFFPLEGSFRVNVGKDYEIYDQWVEILPTDQIVPVEVKYDPKTGRQIS
jgi:hypothetical protein